jgi:hypothetical protein
VHDEESGEPVGGHRTVHTAAALGNQRERPHLQVPNHRLKRRATARRPEHACMRGTGREGHGARGTGSERMA